MKVEPPKHHKTVKMSNSKTVGTYEVLDAAMPNPPAQDQLNQLSTFRQAAKINLNVLAMYL